MLSYHSVMPTHKQLRKKPFRHRLGAVAVFFFVVPSMLNAWEISTSPGAVDSLSTAETRYEWKTSTHPFALTRTPPEAPAAPTPPPIVLPQVITPDALPKLPYGVAIDLGGGDFLTSEGVYKKLENGAYLTPDGLMIHTDNGALINLQPGSGGPR